MLASLRNSGSWRRDADNVRPSKLAIALLVRDYCRYALVPSKEGQGAAVARSPLKGRRTGAKVGPGGSLAAPNYCSSIHGQDDVNDDLDEDDQDLEMDEDDDDEDEPVVGSLRRRRRGIPLDDSDGGVAVTAAPLEDSETKEEEDDDQDEEEDEDGEEEDFQCPPLSSRQRRQYASMVAHLVTAAADCSLATFCARYLAKSIQVPVPLLKAWRTHMAGIVSRDVGGLMDLSRDLHESLLGTGNGQHEPHVQRTSLVGEFHLVYRYHSVLYVILLTIMHSSMHICARSVHSPSPPGL
jgi:hypothetical protein